MSSDNISVGDECVIVGGCCDTTTRLVKGLECKVDAFISGGLGLCQFCRALDRELTLISFASTAKKAYIPKKFLQKKPPKPDEAEPRTDFTPARPKFVEELQRVLTKQTESA